MARHWHDRAFGELSAAEVYALIQLREQVFVVEQRCAYLEADGADATARHVYREDLAAYLRVLPAGGPHAQVRIGRVLVAPGHRGAGLARELMRRGIESARTHHGPVPIAVAAQAHLEGFYRGLGFLAQGNIYDDDGIPHVDMLLSA
jgi:ElaA protein